MSIDDRQGSNPIEQRLQPKLMDFSPATTITSVTSATSFGNRPNPEEGGLDVGRVFKVLQRRLWIVVLVNALTIGAALAWSRTRPLEYEGSFKILIEPATAEGQVVAGLKGSEASMEEQDLGSAQSAKVTVDYPTQIQILLSDKILLPVVKELQGSNPKASYNALKKSLAINRFKEQSDTKILEVRYLSRSSNETKQAIDLISRAYIQYSLSERQTNVSRAIQFVDSQLPTAKSQVQDLESSLQSFREKHQLIDPTTLGTQLSAQTGNVQQEIITAQIELAKTKQLYTSLQKQLQLQPKEAEAGSVLSEAPGYQQLVKQLQDIDVELQSQSVLLTEENPKIIALREKRAKILPLLQQNANAALGSSLSQGTANAQSLPYQNSLRQDLSKQYITAANQIQVLEAKLNSLNLANQTLSTQTNQLPVISRQYEDLQRRLKLATEQLSKFSQKRAELALNAARQEVPWELIAAPTVKEIASSKLLNDLALGLVAGLLLGTGLAILLEKMNDVIYSEKDLREELHISVLGMIPKYEDAQKAFKNSRAAKTDHAMALVGDSNDDRKHNQYKFSPFTESFRALNSQIRLLRPDSPVRSLVVSSSVATEGKTTVAIHLAQAAAAMGQRVLLVNADLRKESTSDLATQNHNLVRGLTDVIAGRIQLMEAVKLFPGKENLYVLPAGDAVADPTSLLGSQKMRDLMASCKNNFDLVIYDTVPLNFADSLLLIPQTDGLLMVTSLGKVRHEDLRSSLNTLEVAKVPVLGLVVNMANKLSVRKGKDRPVAIAKVPELLDSNAW
jgi:polysaccharide biosynthesis transport protein